MHDELYLFSRVFFVWKKMLPTVCVIEKTLAKNVDDGSHWRKGAAVKKWLKNYYLENDFTCLFDAWWPRTNCACVLFCWRHARAQRCRGTFGGGSMCVYMIRVLCVCFSADDRHGDAKVPLSKNIFFEKWFHASVRRMVAPQRLFVCAFLSTTGTDEKAPRHCWRRQDACARTTRHPRMSSKKWSKRATWKRRCGCRTSASLKSTMCSKIARRARWCVTHNTHTHAHTYTHRRTHVHIHTHTHTHTHSHKHTLSLSLTHTPDIQSHRRLSARHSRAEQHTHTHNLHTHTQSFTHTHTTFVVTQKAFYKTR